MAGWIMIFAFLLLAGIGDCVPAHWPSGDPKSLDLLAGTGIDCILVGTAQLTPDFLKQAARRGIATVALVRPNANAVKQARQAALVNVQAIALEGDFTPDAAGALAATGPPVIELPSRQNIRLDSGAPVTGTWQGLWPGIVIEHGGKVMAGPSSNPWIDTNTGFLHFVRASASGAVWLGASPPPGTAIPPQRYGIAISDAAAAGAHWIITLDDDLQRRVLARDPNALAEWKRIVSYAQYFEAHREWKEFRPFSRMAVAQDKDSGGLLSASLLDLMFAQHLAAVSVPASRVGTGALSGVRTVINLIPPDRLTAQQRSALAGFARSGGSLIDPPANWRLGADAPGRITPTRQQLNRIQDIWETLYNATARKNFGARSFNTAGILFNLLESPDRKRLLIHLVNYTEYPADTITLQALGTWKRARLFQPGASVRDLAVYPVKDGTGIDLDKLDVVATLLLE